MTHKANEKGNGNGRVANALDINGGYVKALRLLTPAGVAAILIFAYNAGSTLNHIDDLSYQNCVANHQTQSALHREHKHDKFRGLFPEPSKGCQK